MPWSVVVPVKRLPQAKSRLYAVSRSPAERAALALALALDTVAAAAECALARRVVVVTDDDRATAAMQALGMLVTPDKPDAGLNAALAHGAAVATALDPRDGVATLSSDLPALRPDELAAALAAAARHPRAFVPDAAGSGTTLLTARPGRRLDPRYGPRSTAAHRESGAVELVGAWPSLTRDVDTPDDLRAAVGLGLGQATRAWLAEHDLAGQVTGLPPAGRPAVP